MFSMPLYREFAELKAEASSYDEALGNSKALEDERDKLASKYNSFSTEDLSRLAKLLPENVDNIRLILEIEKLASPYGMILRDVRYNTAENGTPGVTTPQRGVKQSSKNYGTMELQFTTSGTYGNFIKFIGDLENNLRIVDIASITFSSNQVSTQGKADSASSYDYSFKIKTYWLKN